MTTTKQQTPVIEAAEYEQGVIVWIDGQPYDLAVKDFFANGGWTMIDDYGRWYPQQTVPDMPPGYGSMEGLTNDPQLVALTRLAMLVALYGAPPDDGRPGRLPVPDADETELINREFTGSEKSAANQRLAQRFKLDQPLASSSLWLKHQGII